MIAATLALLLQVQEDPLRDAWPRLIEAWKAVETYKPSGALDDDFIKTMGKVHAAFEAAGFFGEDRPFEAGALKRLLQIRAERIVPKRALVLSGVWTQTQQNQGPVYGLDTLLESVKKLNELREKGLADEDNLEDEMTNVRKSLKALHVTADETPLWLRRRVVGLTRAIVMGESYPEPAKASDEEARQIREWIEQLGGQDIEMREKATQELIKVGEKARPFLLEAVKSVDPEVSERARRILGVGHEPWKTSMKPQDPAIRIHDAILDFGEALRIEPAVEPKKDE